MTEFDIVDVTETNGGYDTAPTKQPLTAESPRKGWVDSLSEGEYAAIALLIVVLLVTAGCLVGVALW